MLTLIGGALVAGSLVIVLAYGAHTRLRHPQDVSACDCRFPADVCCRRCLLHEACGVRSNHATGEVACRVV
jgi:hypothetical protein